MPAGGTGPPAGWMLRAGSCQKWVGLADGAAVAPVAGAVVVTVAVLVGVVVTAVFGTENKTSSAMSLR